MQELICITSELVFLSEKCREEKGQNCLKIISTPKLEELHIFECLNLYLTHALILPIIEKTRT